MGGGGNNHAQDGKLMRQKTEKQQKKINKTKSCFFEMTDKS